MDETTPLSGQPIRILAGRYALQGLVDRVGWPTSSWPTTRFSTDRSP